LGRRVLTRLAFLQEVEFESVVIPPEVLEKLWKKHHKEEYEIYQALLDAERKRKSRGRWVIMSRTLGGRPLRIYFEEFKGTITVLSGRADK